jgi:hypothetical protein
MLDFQKVPKTAITARGRSFGNRGYRVMKGKNLWELNETAELIWKACDGSKTVDEILALVATEFNCSRDESDPSCLSFFTFLVENELVVVE